MGLMDILNQYAGSARPQADTATHFDQAASQLPAANLGGALAAMFRSPSTPPFGQLVGNLFGQSNPQQQAGMLNQLVQSLGPAAMGAGGGVLGRLLGTSQPTTAVPSITPQQASQVSPQDVTAIASHAEQQNPSIVDTMGSFYAQHPTLVKSLGVAALAVALGEMQKT